MKCIARVQAGVCGFTTTVTADSPDDQMVTFGIETDCQKIAGLADALRGREIDAYDEIHAGFEGVVMSAVSAALSGCCAGCAVPVGIFKSLQVAARVALPRDINISLQSQ
jgi:hypothetical protein